MKKITQTPDKIADGKLKCREWLLKNHEYPSETEMRKELGDALADVVLTTLSPQAKELMNVRNENEKDPPLRIDRNVSLTVDHNSILRLGLKIEKKIGTETRELCRKANAEQMFDMKNDFCARLSERLAANAIKQKKKQLEIENEISNLHLGDRHELINIFEDKRGISNASIKDDFQKTEDEIIPLVIQDVKKKMREKTDEILRSELEKQQNDFEQSKNDFISNTVSPNTKLLIKFIEEYNKVLDQRKINLKISEKMKIDEAKEEIRMKSHEDVNILQQKLDEEIIELQNEIEVIKNKELKINHGCPNVSIWKQKCLHLLEEYESAIEQQTNAVEGQGRFFLSFDELIQNPDSEDFHDHPFYKCIYICGGYREFYPEKKEFELNDTRRYAIDSILSDIIEESMIKTRDTMKSSGIIEREELDLEKIIVELNKVMATSEIPIEISKLLEIFVRSEDVEIIHKLFE